MRGFPLASQEKVRNKSFYTPPRWGEKNGRPVLFPTNKKAFVSRARQRGASTGKGEVGVTHETHVTHGNSYQTPRCEPHKIEGFTPRSLVKLRVTCVSHARKKGAGNFFFEFLGASPRQGFGASREGWEGGVGREKLRWPREKLPRQNPRQIDGRSTADPRQIDTSTNRFSV